LVSIPREMAFLEVVTRVFKQTIRRSAASKRHTDGAVSRLACVLQYPFLVGCARALLCWASAVFFISLFGQGVRVGSKLVLLHFVILRCVWDWVVRFSTCAVSFRAAGDWQGPERPEMLRGRRWVGGGGLGRRLDLGRHYPLLRRLTHTQRAKTVSLSLSNSQPLCG